MNFSAPLSALTHDVFATRPASAWLAAGEVGRVIFLANTPHDWRFAALQAVHELVEAIIHRHNNVTQVDIDTADFDTLDGETPSAPRSLDFAHACGVAWEMCLAARLGIPPLSHAAVVASRYSGMSISAALARNLEAYDTLLRAAVPSRHDWLRNT